MGQTAFRNTFNPPATISTGSLYLDQALSIGGFPLGSMTEISGEASTGKSTLCLHMIAEAQRCGGICLLVDSDLSFDYAYATRCGVTPDQLYLVQTTCAEETLDIIDRLAGTGAFIAIVLDSLTSLVPSAALNAPPGTFSEEFIEPILSKRLPHILATIQRARTAFVVTNTPRSGMSRVYHQLESNINRLAFPLQAAIRLVLNQTDENCAERPIQRIQVQVSKNQFAPCSKTVDIDIIVNRGLNKTGELIDLGERYAVISRRDSNYYFRDKSLGSRLDEVNFTLQFDPGLAHEIECALRQKMFIR